VLCANVTAETKSRILQSVPDPEFVQLLDIDPSSLPNWLAQGTGSETSPATVGILNIAPEIVNPDRFVFLDADTCVRSDIGALLSHELRGDITLAATYDHVYTVFDCRTQRLSAAGAPSGRRFNSGVMLIGSRPWFEDQVAHRARRIVSTQMIMDQGALNVVCHNRWQELEPGWNVTTQALLRSKKFRVSPNDVLIRHLTAVKPWIRPITSRDASRLMLEDFLYHLARTAWADLEVVRPASCGSG